MHAGVLLLPATAHPDTTLPGQELPDLPGMFNIWWLAYTQGIQGGMHSRMIMYPAVTDRFTIQGFPLDALFGAPWVAAFGLTAGFTLGVWSFLSGAGISMAWLAGRWWKSPIAALAGGIAFQTAGIYLREINQGRSVHVLGAAFVPVGIALALDATDGVSQRRRDVSAALSGLCAALSALAYWYWGVFVAGMLVATAIACFPERRALVRPIAVIFVSGLVFTSGPLLYTIGQAGSHAGVNATLFDEVQDHAMLLNLLESRDLGSVFVVDGAAMIRPLSAILCILASLTALKRVGLPWVWLAGGAVLAMGPMIQLPPIGDDWIEGIPLPGPFASFSLVPLLRRLWWPDRMLFVGSVGFALLVAGGVARIVGKHRMAAVPLLLALLAEPWLVSRNLPLDSTPLDDPRMQAIVTTLASGTGPLMLLPLTHPDGFADLDFYLLQPLYGRPTVNGNIEPDATIAPLPFQLLFASGPPAELYACEGGNAPGRKSSLPGAVATWFRDAGVHDIYIDMDRASVFGPSYLDCVTGILGAGEDSGKFRTFRLQ